MKVICSNPDYKSRCCFLGKADETPHCLESWLRRPQLLLQASIHSSCLYKVKPVPRTISPAPWIPWPTFPRPEHTLARIRNQLLSELEGYSSSLPQPRTVLGIRISQPSCLLPLTMGVSTKALSSFVKCHPARLTEVRAVKFQAGPPLNPKSSSQLLSPLRPSRSFWELPGPITGLGLRSVSHHWRGTHTSPRNGRRESHGKASTLAAVF